MLQRAECTERVRLFTELDENEFAIIADQIGFLHLEPDSLIYRQGEEGSCVYPIRQGLVKLVQSLPNGKERIVRLHGPGDTVGMEVILRHPYQHTAIVLEPVEACRISVQALKQLRAQHGVFCDRLIQDWQCNVERADFWITQLSSGPVRVRAARLLTLLLELQAANQSDASDPRISLLSCEDMAAIVGTTVETLSRVMADFKRQNILRKIDSKTFTFDVEAVRTLADS